MFAYASRTGNLRNNAVLRRAGWGIMISPKQLRSPDGFRYCLDNGAWSAHTKDIPFDEVAFLRAYERLAAGADFTVLPDIVAGGLRSLDFSLAWRDRLGAPPCLWLLAVQDGMAPEDVSRLVGPDLGIFVGGTTEFKEGTMAAWGRLARDRQAYLHVGRVNSVRRIALCAAAGADSIDGSSVSRYAVNLPKLDNARLQRDFMI